MKPYHGYVIDSARKWALAEFEGVKHGPLPYGNHLVAVAGLVSCFTRDENVIAAAWLHDIVEDFREQFTIDDVRHMTNDRVATLVDLLTDPPGPRELVKPLSLRRIASDFDAILIKLCDRYHNQSTSLLDRAPKFLNLYTSEFGEFNDTLIDPVERIDLVAPLVDGLRKQYFMMGDMLHRAQRVG